ncbi:MAG: tripartite tricarboxylate transporter TctB family protein, partial [Deltaproteobacteria bacterium]|nr:tripartite tricarboxylate transporter TctB family protein [Deltaproteobacteria bacterium]
MKRAEYIISIGLCVFGIFIFILTNTIPLMVAVEKSSVVNARFFPKLMSLLLIILSIVMALENYYQKPTTKQENGSDKDGRNTKDKTARLRLLVLGILCLFYFISFQPLGFLLSSALFMAGFTLILGSRKWYFILSISIVSPLCIYLLFKTLLGAPLPEG